MPTLTIIMDGDNCWPDLRTRPYITVDNHSTIQLAMLDRGMKSGKPSVSFRFELPDGQTVLAETSARLLVTAARAIMAKHPRLFED